MGTIKNYMEKKRMRFFASRALTKYQEADGKLTNEALRMAETSKFWAHKVLTRQPNDEEAKRILEWLGEPRDGNMPEALPTATINNLVVEKYEKALDAIYEAEYASPGLLQEKLHISYQVAAAIMAMLEERGIIEPADGARPRKLVNKL